MTNDQAVPTLLRFGLITDIHHAGFDYGGRHCSKSLARLQSAFEWMKQRGIDLVVNLGDSINCGYGNNQEVEYAKTIGAALAAFPGQVKTLIGNHDIETFTKATFLELLQCGRPCAFEQAGIRFILLDGNNHADGSDFLPGKFTWDQAYLGPGQRALLEDELRKADGKPALVFCHECLDHFVWNDAPDPHLVKDVGEARAIINRFPNVLAVIQGHYHHGRSMMIDGLPYLALASIVGGEAPDPGAAAIVHVRKNGSLDIEGFGRQPSLTLSREA
jgi:3',5'-cyclic AMP phosphodiesterase CpdA